MKSQRERFDAKVDRNGPIPAHRPELGPCHVWTAATQKGYGVMRIDGKNIGAHRFSFFLANGRWPEPNALHRCDNPPCVNEAHLFEGTHQDNVDDMVSKGRHAPGLKDQHGDNHWSRARPELVKRGDAHWSRNKPELVCRGERNGMSKLSDETVRDIVANYALCRVTQKELGERYGVSQAAISLIIRGSRRLNCGSQQNAACTK